MTIYKLGDTRPKISDDVYIAPNATVIGNVELARRVSIWFGTVIRGDNELMLIGEGSNIQDNCVLHSDPGMPLLIGKGCTIGHRAVVHGCSIGDDSLIGMGAIIMNGATIGKDCVIGANALVTEGANIPDGSLVLGSPGKVVRQLDKDQRESLKETALHYQANARMFQDDLREC
jgi:carbonic anhydrase/acetyltransferase-like protein (isoleucine patch superfamily)